MGQTNAETFGKHCNFKDKTATTQISFIGKQATSFSTADRPILKTHVPFHQVKPAAPPRCHAQVSGDQQKTSRITAVCCGATTSSYYFWDPAGLSSGGSVENFKRRRQTELKHGRIPRRQVFNSGCTCRG